MPIITSTNIQNTKTQLQKKSRLRKAAGISTGWCLLGAIGKLDSIVISPVIRKADQINKGLTKDEFKKINESFSNILKITGLDKKGVEITRATKDNIKSVSEIIEKEGLSGIMKFLPVIFKKPQLEGAFNSIVNGENAIYASASKKIVIPDGKMLLAIFHEAGHAINDNFSTLGKILQNSRATSLLTPVILLIALFKNKKNEGEEPKNKFDAAGDFVKNNAGKLAFVAQLPVLIEEGLASINGQKIANKLLSPQLAKKVLKYNVCMYLTYASLAVFNSVGIALASKLKDKIAQGPQEKSQS